MSKYLWETRGKVSGDSGGTVVDAGINGDCNRQSFTTAYNIRHWIHTKMKLSIDFLKKYNKTFLFFYQAARLVMAKRICFRPPTSAWWSTSVAVATSSTAFDSSGRPAWSDRSFRVTWVRGAMQKWPWWSTIRCRTRPSFSTWWPSRLASSLRPFSSCAASSTSAAGLVAFRWCPVRLLLNTRWPDWPSTAANSAAVLATSYLLLLIQFQCREELITQVISTTTVLVDKIQPQNSSFF